MDNKEIEIKKLSEVEADIRIIKKRMERIYKAERFMETKLVELLTKKKALEDYIKRKEN